MFSSSSSSSSSATTIYNSATHPILLLLVMVLLSSVAAAFRTSVAVASTTASHRRSATSTRTTDRGGEDGDNMQREGVLPSASGSSISFATDVVQAATEVLERSHRRYWTETAPPFGIRSGLRKLRRKRGKQRQVREKQEQKKSTEQMGCKNGTMVETSVRSRSVVTGSLLNGVDEGHDASSGDHDASSISSEYTWEDENIDQNDDDLFDNTDPTVTHLCFLVHGHRGQSKDLSYMHAAIQGRSSEVRRERLKELQRLESERSDGEGDGNGEERDDVTAAVDEVRSSLGQRVVVHSVTCNEGKTHDGVRAGGERCVEEMLQVIRKEANRTRRKRQRIRKHNGNASENDDELSEVVDIHLSLVGNSLGGIYCRYAAAQLYHMAKNKNDHDGEPCSNAIFLDHGSIRLHFQTFCTTATPHLGCSRHTYVSLPRSAETVVGTILGETGRDLFRMNDLLYNMSTDPYFLRPLSVFQRRVAYANGYHTDFPVPTSTAAFLHEESSHAHFWEDTAAMDIIDSEIDKTIVAILRTEATLLSSKDFKDDFYDECDDELHAMSKALDSLGWKKIIVDLRPDIPAISLPQVVRKSSMVIKSKMKRGTYDGIVGEELGGGEEDLLHKNGTLADSQVLRASLRRKGSIASKDAKEAFGSPRDGSLHFPVGHNMICAFSRGRVSSHMNRGGRPVMDALAKEIVNGMLGPEIGGQACS